MAETEQLKIQIVMDDGSIKEGFIDIEKKAKKTGDNLGDNLSAGVKKFAATLAAAFTVGKVINFFERTIKEAKDAENELNAFSASLRQIGKYTKESVNDFNNYVDSLEATTGITGGLIMQNAALLTSIGNLSGQGLKDATKASIDLATALQIDVGSAFDLVAKAANGNTGALSRYGIKIDENIPKAQKWAATLELIQKRFGGLAETRLNTFDGALANLSNTFKKFEESIGNFVIQSPVVRTIINTISKSFTDMAKSIEKIQDGKDILKPLIISILEFALIVNDYLIYPLELGFKVIKLGLLGIKYLVDGVAGLFAGLGKLIAETFVFLIRDSLIFVSNAIGVFNSDLAEKLKATVLNVSNNLLQPIQSEYLRMKLILGDTANQLAEEQENAFKSKIGSGIDAYLNKLKTAVEQTKDATDKMSNDTGSSTEKMANSWKVSIDSIKEGVRSGLSQTYQDMGRALQAGENLFEKFGQGIVGIIGDMLISIGNALILEGLAIESFITAITALLPGSGIAAAAAGAGLVIFGSALKASVGKGGSNSPSPTGGGVASSPSTTTELTPQEELTRAEPQTSVVVNVAGDILDSDETGSRVVSLINQAFDKKGVVINQGVFA